MKPTSKTPSRLDDEIAEMAAAQRRLGIMDDKAHRAVTDNIAMRKGVTLGDDLTLKELIAEGRQ